MSYLPIEGKEYLALVASGVPPVAERGNGLRTHDQQHRRGYERMFGIPLLREVVTVTAAVASETDDLGFRSEVIGQLDYVSFDYGHPSSPDEGREQILGPLVESYARARGMPLYPGERAEIVAEILASSEGQ